MSAAFQSTSVSPRGRPAGAPDGLGRGQGNFVGAHGGRLVTRPDRFVGLYAQVSGSGVLCVVTDRYFRGRLDRASFGMDSGAVQYQIQLPHSRPVVPICPKTRSANVRGGRVHRAAAW